jgi:hypothetical protein
MQGVVDIAMRFKQLQREQVIGDLDLLQAQYIWLTFCQKLLNRGEMRPNGGDIPGRDGNFHYYAA